MSNVAPGMLSVIVPVYNRAVFLGQAVDSVLTQSYCTFEIILVDDGSTDDTPEHIAGLVAEHPDVVRTIRIENRGPGGARQAGLDVARGEFIQFLDSDDRLEPGKFDTQVAALNAHPESGIAYGVTRLINGDGEELVRPYKGSGEARDFLFPELLRDRWWNTHTPLYRRSVCDAIGPWTTMRMGEDWEYDARAGAARTKLVFCDQLVSSHRDHGEGRLTRGSLTRDTVADQAQLIPALHRCALSAGVRASAPEMRYFSRWAFLTARRAASHGLAEAARECLRVANDAACGRARGVRGFGLLGAVIGWRAAGRLCHGLDALRAGRRGAELTP